MNMENSESGIQNPEWETGIGRVMRCAEALRVGLALLATAVLVSSCAVLSSSQYDTARTLGKGKAEWGVGTGLGRDIGSGAYLPTDDVNVPVWIIESFARYGFTDRVDAGVKMWISIPSIGILGNGKFRLTGDSSRIQIAVAPGISYTGSQVESPKFGYHDLASGWSFHLPLIFSVHPSMHAAVYWGLQYTFSSVTLHDRGLTKSVHSPSLTLGMKLSPGGGFSIYPEASVYRVSDLLLGRSLFVLLPNLGLSLTF
jgi:hypothetical protein